MNAETASFTVKTHCPQCWRSIHAKDRFCQHCGAAQQPGAGSPKNLLWQQRWLAVRGVVFFYCIFLASILPLYWFPKNKSLFMVVSWVDVILILAYWRHSGVQLRPILRWSRSLGSVLLWTLPITAAVIAINLLYHAQIERWLGIDPAQAGAEIQWLGLIGAIFYFCLMPAFWEEIAFRGLMLEKLLQVTQHREAILLSAVLFAIIHRAIVSFPTLFLIGIATAWLRTRSHSLWPGMMLHFCNNLVAILLIW